MDAILLQSAKRNSTLVHSTSHYNIINQISFSVYCHTDIIKWEERHQVSYIITFQ